jgi:RNA polymerase sporulation-specific sigma factor
MNRHIPQYICTPQSAVDPEVLFRNHTNLVSALTRRYSIIPRDYPDVVQDGQLGLWEAARRYDPSRGAKFSTFAFTFVRRAISRSVKTKRKRETLSSEIPEELSEKLEPCDESTEAETLEQEADGRSRREHVREFKDSLPPVQRKVVELIFWQGLSQAEVARQLQVNPSRITRILSRIIARGRDQLSHLQ